MATLVTGSIAYDTIMVFPDRFKNHLLADQLHILNVCFLTPEMRREFGGTAGNIGYNLRLLGAEPLVMATVGEDVQPYLERLARLGTRGAGGDVRLEPCAGLGVQLSLEIAADETRGLRAARGAPARRGRIRPRARPPVRREQGAQRRSRAMEP